MSKKGILLGIASGALALGGFVLGILQERYQQEQMQEEIQEQVALQLNNILDAIEGEDKNE